MSSSPNSTAPASPASSAPASPAAPAAASAALAAASAAAAPATPATPAPKRAKTVAEEMAKLGPGAAALRAAHFAARDAARVKAAVVECVNDYMLPVNMLQIKMMSDEGDSMKCVVELCEAISSMYKLRQLIDSHRGGKNAGVANDAAKTVHDYMTKFTYIIANTNEMYRDFRAGEHETQCTYHCKTVAESVGVLGKIVNKFIEECL